MNSFFILILFTPLLLFSQEKTDTTIVLYPDVEAKFPGGPTEMMKYIRENLEYPKIEFETVPNGRIVIEFIINMDGSIEKVKSRKESVNELDNAYIEVIKNMPNWIPAEVNGVRVRTKMVLPFTICFQ
ncbi:energy transducer TonB [Brumimicrobium mesophilum]|uniref:energy transducer TonB n=1 Tax=Brumimicrobium mesophilum TaxID=392717 RepID=UPI000D1426F1|nr:energy transducer TonB [Brumimicrobium mesophilum]